MTEEVNELESKFMAEETADQTAPADETNPSNPQLSEESKTHGKEDQEEVDYKAELERERVKREKAEQKIVKLKKQQKNNSEDEDIEEVDKSEELVEKVAERLEQGRRQELVEEVLEGMASNPEEKELIDFIYNNKIVKSGLDRQSIIDDLAAAKILANRKKIERENKELAQALKVKSTLDTRPSFGGTKISSPTEPPLSREEKEFLEYFGDDAKERYKKKINS